MEFNRQQYAETLLPLLIEYGGSIIIALVRLVLWWRIIGQITKWIKTPLHSAIHDISVRRFLISFLSILLKVLLLVSIASLLWLETTSLIAALWAAGIAIWLALQWSLSNVAWGLLILIFKPFSVGDYITAQGYSGIVQSINVLYTTLNTIKNEQITIPNGNLANGVMKNYTANEERQLEFDLGISYDASIKDAKKVIEQVLRDYWTTIRDDEIFIGVSELADSAVVIKARAWIPAHEFVKSYHELLENFKLALDEAGIGIPYPQVVVHNAGKK